MEYSFKSNRDNVDQEELKTFHAKVVNYVESCRKLKEIKREKKDLEKDIFLFMDAVEVCQACISVAGGGGILKIKTKPKEASVEDYKRAILMNGNQKACGIEKIVDSRRPILLKKLKICKK